MQIINSSLQTPFKLLTEPHTEKNFISFEEMKLEAFFLMNLFLVLIKTVIYSFVCISLNLKYN